MSTKLYRASFDVLAWIDRLSIVEDAKVQMWARALTSVAGQADDFALVHICTFLGEHAFEVRVERLVIIAVPNDHIVAEYSIVACIGDSSFSGRFDGRPSIDDDVDRCMEGPLATEWIAAISEWRGNGPSCRPYKGRAIEIAQNRGVEFGVGDKESVADFKDSRGQIIRVGDVSHVGSIQIRDSGEVLVITNGVVDAVHVGDFERFAHLNLSLGT